MSIDAVPKEAGLPPTEPAVRLPGSAAGRPLHVEFAHGRCCVHEVSLQRCDAPGERVPLRRLAHAPHVFRLDHVPDSLAGEHVHVHAAYHGGPLVLARIALEQPYGGSPTAEEGPEDRGRLELVSVPCAAGSGACEETPGRVPTDRIATLHRDAFERRRAIIEEDARIARFFCAFDEASLGAESEGRGFASLRYALEQRLKLRIRAASGFRTSRRDGRGRYVLDGRAPEEPQVPRYRPFSDLDTRRDAARCSELLVRLDHEHLGNEPARFAWGFERFVAGELAVRSSNEDEWGALRLHGVPDSSQFFLVPELAAACIDNGIDDDFWRPRFAGLVCAAHLNAFKALRSGRLGPRERVFFGRDGGTGFAWEHDDDWILGRSDRVRIRRQYVSGGLALERCLEWFSAVVGRVLTNNNPFPRSPERWWSDLVPLTSGPSHLPADERQYPESVATCPP